MLNFKFNLEFRTKDLKLINGFGDVAQLGERRLCKPEVEGSIPFVSILVACYWLLDTGKKQTTRMELIGDNCVLAAWCFVVLTSNKKPVTSN
jgi:hypothetical protein